MSSMDMGPEGTFRWVAEEVELPDGDLVQVDTEIRVYDGKLVEVRVLSYTDEHRTYELRPRTKSYREIWNAVWDHLDDRWDGGLAEVVCSDSARV